MKVCPRCKIEKELAEFGKSKRSKDGLRFECKKCHNNDNKKWADNHRIQTRRATKDWYEKNVQRARDTGKIWRKKNEEKKKLQVKKWSIAHPEKVKAYSRKGSAKIRSTLKGRLNDSLSSAIYRSIGKEKSGRRWESLVGYTIEQLKTHIEKQFKPGMSWENYGKYTWHIDHIIPIAAFNFSQPEDIDFRRAWALSNLQPLEAKRNHSKKDKVLRPFQPSLALQEVVNG